MRNEDDLPHGHLSDCSWHEGQHCDRGCGFGPIEPTPAPAEKPGAFLILNASIRGPSRYSWRPLGAKRSRKTGLPTREAAIASLTAAGFRLVDRPANE